MLTHFLNHVIHGDTPTPSFQGILQPRFSKLSRFKNLSVKMISHSRGYSNPILLRGYSNPIFQLQINHPFFFLGFHEFVKQTLFNQETQMHLENCRFGYSQIIDVNSEINSNSPFLFFIIALNDPCYVISFITNMISL